MSEIEGMLQKIRTLAVQANNGTNTAADREALSKEASALGNEISRIARKQPTAERPYLTVQTFKAKIALFTLMALLATLAK